jgi:hypothetical protein
LAQRGVIAKNGREGGPQVEEERERHRKGLERGKKVYQELRGRV